MKPSARPGAPRSRSTARKCIRVPGNYDDSVRHAADEARKNGWTVVSDTTYEGYRDIPVDVMHGYGVMSREIVRAMADKPPTHVFVQAGVGALAASVCAAFWLAWAARRPELVIVEPTRADCHFQSAIGRPAGRRDRRSRHGDGRARVRRSVAARVGDRRCRRQRLRRGRRPLRARRDARAGVAGAGRSRHRRGRNRREPGSRRCWPPTDTTRRSGDRWASTRRRACCLSAAKATPIRSSIGGSYAMSAATIASSVEVPPGISRLAHRRRAPHVTPRRIGGDRPHRRRRQLPARADGRGQGRARSGRRLDARAGSRSVHRPHRQRVRPARRHASRCRR